MTKYTWKNGGWKDKKTGQPMIIPARNKGKVFALRHNPDLPDYVSPVTGEVVSGRAERREDMKRNDCYDLGPPEKKRGFINKSFCKRRGLEHDPELADQVKNKPKITGDLGSDQKLDAELIAIADRM